MDNNINFEDEDLKMIDTDKIDPDIEEVEDTSVDKVDTNDGSILTSDYEDLPPIESDEFEPQKEHSINIEYSFKGEDVVEGLSTMQALLQFKKNMTYTGILSVIFFVYMLDFANFQSLILGMLCLVVIGVIWLMPKFHIKRFAKAADENDIKFSMSIYSNSIEVSNTSNTSNTVRLSFNKQINNIIETDNLFVICSGKERIFIVPKRCINESLHEFIREIFQIAMGENFYQKNIII